jgi:hypothetical protein
MGVEVIEGRTYQVTGLYTILGGVAVYLTQVDS